MARLVTRFLRDKNGRVVKRKIRADKLDEYQDRIVVKYRKPRTLRRTQKRAERGPSTDLGDYSNIITGFVGEGNVNYELFPFPITNGPIGWHSNEGFFLGRVLFPGNISLSVMSEMLDRSLNYQGARQQHLNYQDCCVKWRIKYQQTGIRNGKRLAIAPAIIKSGRNSVAVIRQRAR